MGTSDPKHRKKVNFVFPVCPVCPDDHDNHDDHDDPDDFDDFDGYLDHSYINHDC